MTYVSITAALPELLLCPDERLPYAQPMQDRPEDSALMLRYRDGDLAAFDRLYRRHKDSLYRYLLRLTRNRHTAEDVFQEAWGKVIKARQNYRPTAMFSTYLFRVAHNCFIDHVRRNKRHGNETADDPDRSPAPGAAPEQIAERQLARERLERALRELPDEQRDVFLLYAEGGLSLDDIASVTGANRETAKSRLRYAVGKLKVAVGGGTATNVLRQTK